MLGLGHPLCGRRDRRDRGARSRCRGLAPAAAQRKSVGRVVSVVSAIRPDRSEPENGEKVGGPAELRRRDGRCPGPAPAYSLETGTAVPSVLRSARRRSPRSAIAVQVFRLRRSTILTRRAAPVGAAPPCAPTATKIRTRRPAGGPASAAGNPDEYRQSPPWLPSTASTRAISRRTGHGIDALTRSVPGMPIVRC